MIRAIAFTRVSTGRQDEGERQLVQIRKYCELKGYALQERVIGEVISGKADDRTGLIELKELTTADADIVVVSEASRLTRKNEDDFMDLYSIVKSIQKTGLDLYILGSGHEYKADVKLSLVDVISLVIEADRNSKERETNVIRFASAKEKMAQKGYFTGHKLAYGYAVEKIKQEKGKDKGVYILNESEAETVKLMFNLVGKQGYTIGKLTKYLNRIQDKQWILTVIAKMLHNPVYKGELKIHGTTIKIPPIVTAEEFDLVQEMIKSNHLHLNKGEKRFNQLKGLAKCACGCSFYLNATGVKVNNYRNYVHYKCMSKNRGSYKGVPCTNTGADESLLNSVVWNIVKSFINIDDFKAQTAEQEKSIKLEIRGIQRQIASLDTEKSELDTQITNTTNLLISTTNLNIIPTLETKLSKLISNEDKVSKQIKTITTELNKLNIKLKDLAETLLPSLVENVQPEEKNKIFKKYIETVTYHSITRNKGIAVINFKNSVKSVILIKTRPALEAYQLPQTFKFNPENRTVLTALDIPIFDAEFATFNNPTVEATFVDGTDFEIPEENRMVTTTTTDIEITVNPTTYKEASYSELFERFNMEEFKMEFN